MADRFAFFFQAEDGIRDKLVTGVQTCALPIWNDLGDLLADLQALARAVLVDAHEGEAGRLHRRMDLEDVGRSEERRVGKECRSRGWAYHEKKKRMNGNSRTLASVNVESSSRCW